VKTAVVVGTGAGGATAARELQGAFDVTILEAGREFRPFAPGLALPDALKRAGLLFDEREIGLLFPAMKIEKTTGGIVHVRGIGTGGTTTLATGNALRQDRDLREIGVDLAPELAELEREIPISTAHQARWRESTRELFDACRDMGLAPAPLPKMGTHASCTRCGRCVLGCPAGVKWDTRAFVRDAVGRGSRLRTACRVTGVRLESGRAAGVEARCGGRRVFVPADLVVLAAGGIGTPMILQDSGIRCDPRLFVDPVLCVAAPRKGALQNREISMPFAAQRDGYIVAPYFDYLSWFFNRAWRRPAADTVSLMIKLADTEQGGIDGRRIDKGLADRDRVVLDGARDLCLRILEHVGIDRRAAFVGTLNAGHPGGMLPLGPGDARTLHPARLPANLYVADATLLPRSLGNPPILTVMALARRVARAAAAAVAD
jgi:choline dehydrogenase-like flavoprotein